MEFTVLGPLEVRERDRLVEIRRGIPRALLSALVLMRGNVVRFDRLIDLLWGEQLPANPANALQTQVAYLRRVLGRPGSPIVTRPSGYVLDIPAEAVDASRFEALVASARRLVSSGTAASLGLAVEQYEMALRLWRGDAYAEIADLPFAEAEAARLEQLRLQTWEERLDALLALGQHGHAAVDAATLVTTHPYRERYHEQLALALYRGGRQADALRAIDAARRILGEELGLSPGPGLRRLEQLVLQQDPELDWLQPHGGSVEGGTDASPPAVAQSRLPRAATTLIGRDAELDRLATLVARARVLTLTGPGGSGKTRLALELAQRESERRPVVFADLALVSRDEDVALAVAETVGLESSDETDVVVALAKTLASSDVLVVLDTCEHVLAGAAEVAAAFVTGCPRVSVLATSRHPLGVDGELAWPVPPLALPSEGEDPSNAPAVQLFVERARAAKGDIVFDAAALDEVAAICREIDRLPLAIELAAAQCDVLSPEAIHAHLADRFDLLVAPVASARPVERLRTLRGAIGWSVNLLSEDERFMLYRLGVFAGSFDELAAAAVAEVPVDVAGRTLAALTRASLVTTAEGGRYRLLDSIRAFAQEALADAGEERDARRRHALHFTTKAERAVKDIQGERQNERMRDARWDIGNYRIAFDWSLREGAEPELGARLAAALTWVWMVDGLLPEARRAIEAAAAIVTEDPLVRARVLRGVGVIAAPLGDLARAREACVESVEICRRCGAELEEALSLLTLGVAQWGLGDHKDAVASHTRALEVFERVRHEWGAIGCRVLLARTALETADLEEAERRLDGVVEDARRLGEAHLVALAFEQHARLALARGELEAALLAATQCLAAGEQFGYGEAIIAGLNLLGRVNLLEGNAVGARAQWQRALAAAWPLRHAAATCEALENLAELSALDGDHEHAALLILHARRMRDRRGIEVRASSTNTLQQLEATVRGALGERWNSIERMVPITSVDDLVTSLLAPQS